MSDLPKNIADAQVSYTHAITAPPELHHNFSPSRLQQFALCPGSYKMQLGLKGVPSEAAEEGKKLHAAVASNSTKNLSPEQADLVEKCLAFLNQKLSLTQTPITKVQFEVTLPLDFNGRQLCFGTTDVLWQDSPDHANIIDWKFGRNPVPDANENLQLAAYAAEVMQFLHVSSVTVYLFQPRLFVSSEYTFTNFSKIADYIAKVIDACNSPVLKLNAGQTQCRFCLASPTCPAFKMQANIPPALDISSVSDQTLVELYEKSKLFKKFADAVEAELKDRINSNGSCSSYVFKTKDGNREVKDVPALFARVKDFLTPAEFLQFCKVSIASLESNIVAKLQHQAISKNEKLLVKDAKASANNLYADLICRASPSKSIVKLAE